MLPVLTIYRSRCAGKSKGGELEESLPKFALAQEKKNGCERCGEGKQREHYEYELQGRHTPYVRAFVRLNGRTSRPSTLDIIYGCILGSNCRSIA